MKKILLAVAAAVLGAAVALIVRPSVTAQQSRPSGRFQLLPAKYTVIMPSGPSIEDQGLFRIDTDTGITWVYQEGVNKQGSLFRRWDQVPEQK